MAVQQLKIGIAGMIEGRVIPVFRRMAPCTIVTTTAVMGVIFSVAADTSRWRARECTIFVTSEALGTLMFADQRKVRCRVIKPGVEPLGRLVAGCTIGTHGLFVRQVFLVTIDAVGLHLTVLRVGGMASGTLGLQMCAGYFEVSKRMIEEIFIENDDDRVPTFVLGMTS